MHTATNAALKLLGVHIHVTGMEKVPKDTRFLLVSNHRSNYDPLVTWHVFRKYDLAFVSKPENFKIPMFGRIIRKCCFLPIDRVDPRNAIVTINKAADLIKADTVSMGIYPEGTRSREKNMLPFHNGVFKIAKKADVPIVVITVTGTDTIYRVQTAVGIRFGQRGTKEYSTIDAMKHCRAPVLFVHGTDDTFVRVSMTYENYQACTAPKQLLIVPGASHGLSYYVEKDRYEKVVKAFWAAYDA